MIIFLMSRIVSYYSFAILLSCICNLKDVFSEVPTSVYLKYKGKYTSDIKNYEVVVPQRVNKDGNFISHLVSHHHSKRSIEELDFIFYKIPIGGRDYLIELTPNRQLISPGAVIEVHREDVRRSPDRKFLNDSSRNETIGEIFRKLDIQKLENTECHFLGHVKGENVSKAALSTCYGLAGFIQIKKILYTIEPVAEHNPFIEDTYPHILYKADGLENSSVCHTMEELTVSLVNKISRKRRESNNGLSLPMFIETLIVLDKTLINYHQDSDCENYVLTVFNMAFNLFQDASAGLMMTLTIVRIIRLEVENDEMNLRVNADAEKTLRYFQTWQYEINPGDDSHPNHHDIAVLITRVNICYSPSSCGLLGLTTIGKACDPKLSAALCADNGLRLGYVIAHEIGHLLGADHDSGNSTCNGTDANGFKTVMHPQISTTSRTWSTCSQAYFKAFYSSGLGNCLFDEPEEHHFNVQDLLPGVMYNADFQCKHLISSNARECDMGSTCDSLNCFVPGYACIITHMLPVDGTHCGENMWCHDTRCLIVGERPGAIDGNWGEWSVWSDCSRTCGSGVASATRNCDKPHPSHGGKNCVGERKRYKICAATVISYLIRFISEEVNVSFVGKPCETGRPSFRDIQCGEFNDWIYPEDGKVHTWKAYFFHDDNPCILYCINEEKQVAALRPRVVDGTMCFRGIRDVCVAGTCKTLPCDLNFESNAVEDACGVCHGDGTECEFSAGTETLTKLAKGLTKLVNVPMGARNINVQMLSPSLAKIIVRDKDTREIYIRGKSLGMFNVPGSQAWLGMIKKNQKALNIPGPVAKPLSIWIQRLDNVTVKWSMGLPTEQQRKPEFAWSFLKWGPCSAKCGPGTQKSEPSCIEEKAGLVEDSFCADLEMPRTKVRRCEVAKCEPRWMVGDWKDCEQPNTQKKERKRIVYCIKPIGEGEGESEIVSDSECTKPKPHECESCENRQKRENTKNNVESNFFEPCSKFKSNEFQVGVHKEYDDYLKFFAELFVPQRSNETIPLSLVYSPHFKDYFHILEIPDNSKIAFKSKANISLSKRTSSNARTEHKASSDVYKKILKRRQIGFNHGQSVSNEIGVLKKSVKLDGSKSQKKNSTVQFYVNLRNIYKRSKWLQNGQIKKKNTKFYFDTKQKSPIPLRKNRENSPKNIRSVKLNFFQGKNNKKKFNYTSPNLKDVFEKLQESEKSRFAKLINRNSTGKLSLFERTKLNSQQWNAFNTKNFHNKLNSVLSFFSKSNLKSNEKYDSSADNTQLNLMKLDHKEFDGSGARKLSLADQKFQKKTKNCYKQSFIKKDSFHANPFTPISFTGKPVMHLKKNFKGKHLAFETFFTEKRGKRYRRKKKYSKGKRTTEACLFKRKRTTEACLFKRKRSNRIWKKPKPKEFNSKPRKEQCGGTCGTETRNYLNNLFRDNHPKIFTPKPAQANKSQELKSQYKNPVIKEGTLVIDKDLVENQQMEVIFEDDETGKNRKKFLKLPQPGPNEKKLTLKGQDVFNLLTELQLSGDFDKTKNGNEEKVETNISKSKNGTEIREKSKNTKEKEKFSGSTSISKNIANKTPPGQLPTEISEPQTTNSKPEDDSEESDYDIDDIGLENPIPNTKKTIKNKKKKKKQH